MKQRNALIVWGGWEGHQPEQCAAIVEQYLVEEGFAVVKENKTSAFADPDLGKFDLIIPIFTMGSVAMPNRRIYAPPSSPAWDLPDSMEGWETVFA